MGDAFDFFRQETSNSEPFVRAEAMAKLLLIASLMNPEKVRSDMVPYLISKMKDVDQVLLELAIKIGSILPLMGGADHAHLLIPIFEPLCDTEEGQIRTATTASIKKALSSLSPRNTTQAAAYFELFKRLCVDDNPDVFYPRVSAAQIVDDVYKIMPENGSERVEIREAFTKLAKDEYVLVRRAACQSMVALSDCVPKEVLTTDFYELYKFMVTDEHQPVRINAVEYFAPFVVQLKRKDAIGPVLPDLLNLIKSTYEDISWRIRLAFAKDYGEMASCFDGASTSSTVFPGIMQLIQDPEPEVRTKSLGNINRFLTPVGPPTFLNEYSPIASQMVNDPVAAVRKALAEASVDIAAKVGSELVAQHLSDIVIKVMNDEDPLVKLRIIRKLPVIAEDIPSLCTRLTDLLKATFGDPNWRVRKEISLAMPAVVKYMGKEFFMDQFQTGFLSHLKDGVGEVREACAKSIAVIASSGNAEYVHEKFYSTIRSMTSDQQLVRITAVLVLDGLLQVANLPEKLRVDLLNLLINLSSDKVANVRLRVAQTIGVISKALSPEINRAQLRPVLTTMQGDKDKDVVYFATLSAKSLVS